jgi:dTMP kinase
LWWASAISSLGDWITFFAALSLADTISGSNGASFGILVPLIGRLIPGLLLGPAAGVVADRLDRKLVMIVSDFGRGAIALSLVFADDLVTLGLISAAMEVLTLVRQPAREAAVPTLVSTDQLVSANSLSLAAAYGTAPVGSALAAVFAQLYVTTRLNEFFATWEGMAFAADAITFALSGLIVVTIAIPAPALVREARKEPRSDRSRWRSSLTDMKVGIAFVSTEGQVRRVVLGMAAALFGGGALIALGKPFADDVLLGSGSGFGILVTALGLGVGAGMLVVATVLSDAARRDALFALTLTATGLTLMMATIARTVWGAAGWAFLAGMTTGISYVMGFTHLHEVVDDTLRGRTFAALFMVVRTAIILSLALAVTAAQLLDGIFPPPFENGTRNALFIGAVIILVAGLGTIWGVRSAFARKKLSHELSRSMHDATHALGAMHGRRRPDDADE